MPPSYSLPQALLLGIALMAVALLGWIAWGQRVRLRRADLATRQLRADLQAEQDRNGLQQAPVPTSPPNAHDALYRSLLAAVPGASFRCTPDANWSVVFISDAIQALSGYTPANYYASNTLLHDFVHADDRPLVHQQVQAAIAQDESYIVEYRAQHRDGRELWVWEQGHGVRNASGTVIWLDGVIFDISARKHTEIALREAKDQSEAAAAAKAVFLANVGHEVRTPLNAIIGFSEVVLKTSLDAMQREHVYKVRQAARTLLKLINDVLDVARLERGTLTLASAPFSLRELGHEALQAQRAAADRKGLVLHLDADPALPDQFEGDAPRLRQALDKLLDNAVKFTERGTVRLELGQQDGLLLVAVHDTGIGIAPERHGDIFEAFTQADPSMSRRHGGTGLGTTLAQRLIEHMGGQLSMQSTPGVGSSFRVLVPLAPSAATASRPQTTSRPALLASDLPPDAPRPPSLALAEAPTLESLRRAIRALRAGDHADATLAQLLELLREQGQSAQASEVEHALAMFDLDRAADLLETVPARL